MDFCGLLKERRINDKGNFARRFNQVHRLRKDDNIHLMEEGIKLCSERVAEIIFETAKTLEDDSGTVQKFVSDAKLSGAPV